MFRFKFFAFFLRMEFPERRLRAWTTHTPCVEHECDICNPIIGSGMTLW